LALNVNDLKDALKQVFQDGMSATDSDTVAEAMAQAIHDYVAQASVNGVQVTVVNNANVQIGTGTQTVPVNVS